MKNTELENANFRLDVYREMLDRLTNTLFEDERRAESHGLDGIEEKALDLVAARYSAVRKAAAEIVELWYSIDKMDDPGPELETLIGDALRAGEAPGAGGETPGAGDEAPAQAPAQAPSLIDIPDARCSDCGESLHYGREHKCAGDEAPAFIMPGEPIVMPPAIERPVSEVEEPVGCTGAVNMYPESVFRGTPYFIAAEFYAKLREDLYISADLDGSISVSKNSPFGAAGWRRIWPVSEDEAPAPATDEDWRKFADEAPAPTIEDWRRWKDIKYDSDTDKFEVSPVIFKCLSELENKIGRMDLGIATRLSALEKELFGSPDTDEDEAAESGGDEDEAATGPDAESELIRVLLRLSEVEVDLENIKERLDFPIDEVER